MAKEEKFTFDFHGSVRLTKSEIWPGGDAPENPTSEDVAKKVGGDGYTCAVDLAEQMNCDHDITMGVDGVPVKFR